MIVETWTAYAAFVKFSAVYNDPLCKPVAGNRKISFLVKIIIIETEISFLVKIIIIETEIRDISVLNLMQNWLLSLQHVTLIFV